MAPQRKQRGFGSIEMLKSGRFRARHRNPENKAQWVNAPYTFLQRKQASDWLTDQHAKIVTGQWEHPDAVAAREAQQAEQEAASAYPLEQWVNAWLRRLRREGKSANTMRSYTSNLRPFLDTFGDRPIQSISTEELSNWYESLSEPYMVTLKNGDTKTLHRSKKTCQNIAAIARSCFNYAVEDGVLTVSPLKIKGLSSKTTRKNPVAELPTDEQILTAADYAIPVVGAAILIAAYTGLRVGEIAALTRRNMHLVGDNPTIEVRGGTQRDVDGSIVMGAGKSRRAVRDLPVPHSIANRLAAYMVEHVNPEPDAKVVYMPGDRSRLLTDKALWEGKKRWREARAHAGISDRCRFHDLRAAYLTNLGIKGATLAELMQSAGHATADTVMIYQKATSERLRTLADLNDPGQQEEADVVPLQRKVT